MGGSAPRCHWLWASGWGRGCAPWLTCHWPRRRWGWLPVPLAARRRTAGARPAKPARGRLGSSQIRRRPPVADRCAHGPRQRQGLTRGSAAGAALGKTGGRVRGAWGSEEGGRGPWWPSLDSVPWPAPERVRCAAASPASDPPHGAPSEQVALPREAGVPLSLSESIRTQYLELPLTPPPNTQILQF